MGRIYFDHAATTPLDPDVLEAMQPFLSREFGNPSALYQTGRLARQALDEARDIMAASLGARSSREIVFTAGGSEANNLALKGVAWASAERKHIVTSAMEHPAILDAVDFLSRHGFKVTLVKPDANGLIDPDAVASVTTDQTLLVSIMHANNETGIVQPIQEIAAIAHAKGALFHTDAVQTTGHVPVDVNELGCDLLSLAGHKFYGPKGVGALYVRRGVMLEPLIHGGGQEQERRAGTENVAAIVGQSHALRIAMADMDARRHRVEQLRDKLSNELTTRIADVQVNGQGPRLPGHLNVRISDVEGESLLVNLDMVGIEASSGSACTSGSLEASHVLLSMGLDQKAALESVRFSLGRDNTEAQVEQVVDAVEEIVARIRGRRTHPTSGHSGKKEGENE